jgi:hypothetical protein
MIKNRQRPRYSHVQPKRLLPISLPSRQLPHSVRFLSRKPSLPPHHPATFIDPSFQLPREQLKAHIGISKVIQPLTLLQTLVLPWELPSWPIYPMVSLLTLHPSQLPITKPSSNPRLTSKTLLNLSTSLQSPCHHLRANCHVPLTWLLLVPPVPTGLSS